ncbi:methionine ABC transporter permease [Candidatus Rickettsiella viridis]|nr:methionine ABC transporter permease [Candidatus Rickettsiella viridis]
MSMDLLFELMNATAETLYMVLLSGSLAFILGLPLGVLLFVTRPNKLLPHPLLNRCLAMLINITRSIPFIILMVAIIPLTRLLVGTSIGTNAAIVPLSLAAIPFFARMVENSLNELSPGLIEAGQAMGASSFQLIQAILLAEARPGIINSLTITLINLVAYSAMAGAVGGGGLGDLAIRYGYQRFDMGVMLATIVILIAFVQGIQYVGDRWVKRVSH